MKFTQLSTFSILHYSENYSNLLYFLLLKIRLSYIQTLRSLHKKTGQSAPGPFKKSNHSGLLISATVDAFRGHGFSLLVTAKTLCSWGYASQRYWTNRQFLQYLSSGISGSGETPQIAKRPRSLTARPAESVRQKRTSTLLMNQSFFQNT